MVSLICQHCLFLWDYHGNSKYYSSCPQCRYKVNILKGIDRSKLHYGSEEFKECNALKDKLPYILKYPLGVGIH